MVKIGYGSAREMERFERVGKMIRWMYGVTLMDGKAT
jgi:hypothetical protein